MQYTLVCTDSWSCSHSKKLTNCKPDYQYTLMHTAYHYCILIVSLVVIHCFYRVCWLTTRPNITTDVISVYTCSKYIREFLNEKRFAHISVSMFELKGYTLDQIRKKWMPICRICDPPKGFTNWTEFNAHQVRRHGGQDKYKCHCMKGALKN